MKGYKAFNKDLTCRGFQYEVGGTYEMDGGIRLCNRGFHFCETITEVYEYYPTSEDVRVCEVEALGDIVTDGKKFCTDKIKIVREVMEEWKRKGNIYSTSTGYCNNGHYNSGDYNGGNHNSGSGNSGDYNRGHYNSGDYNGGNHNSGSGNSGDYNRGHYNRGNCNYGNYNSGNHNGGNCNCGGWNGGNCNCGDYNSGYSNSGDWNYGNCNVGDFNAGNYNIGCFNTDFPKIKMFNKDSDWTYERWKCSRACSVLMGTFRSASKRFVEGRAVKEESPQQMTAKRNMKKPAWRELVQECWDSLGDEDKKAVLSLPNFDAEIFEECTGIDVGDGDRDRDRDGDRDRDRDSGSQGVTLWTEGF